MSETILPDNFYEIDGGIILCGNCILKWQADSINGRLQGDELYSFDKVLGKAETPAQCDECLEQSDDYDEVSNE